MSTPMTDQELGIFAKTFSRQSVEANLDAVAQHRLGVVQYNMACAGLSALPESIAPERAEHIRLAALERGIRIAAVSGTFNMIHPDLAVRRSGLQRLSVLAGACGGLGTRTITLCTGTRDPDDMWRGHPDNHDLAAWRDLLASMEQAVAIAEAFDIYLVLPCQIVM